MTNLPFGLTQEDLRALGMFTPPDAAPTDRALFRGVPINTTEIAGRHYAWCETADRLFVGEGATQREAFLAMARHHGMHTEAPDGTALTPLALQEQWRRIQEQFGPPRVRYIDPLSAEQAE